MLKKILKRFTNNVVQANGTVTINGKTFETNGASSVSVVGNDVYINGTRVDTKHSEKIINVVVHGDCKGDINCNGSAEVKGNCEGNIDANGSVTIDGSVKGDIDANGKVTIKNKR